VGRAASPARVLLDPPARAHAKPRDEAVPRGPAVRPTVLAC